MIICHIREFSYPIVKSDGVGAIISKISDNLLKTSDSRSFLITRKEFSLSKYFKNGHVDVLRVGLSPSKIFLRLPKVGNLSPRLFFSIYSKDARYLYKRNLAVDGISAIEKLAKEASHWGVLKDVDVFHCHGMYTNFESYLGLFLSEYFQKPLIFQLHGHFGSAPECMNLDLKKPWYDPVVGNKALNASKVIICGNQSTLKILEQRTGNRVKLVFIPTCIDVRLFDPDDKSADSAESILFLARLTDFKDPLTAVRAMKIVVKVRPKAKLKIVGGGPNAKKVKLEIEELGLKENVILFGERVGVCTFFRESSIFLAISPIENFLSNSLLEAMAAGLAIIATDVGETRNIVKDGVNGILVPPSDPLALAQAILSILLRPSLSNDLSNNALDSVKEYDIRTLGPKYVKLYEDAT